MWARHFEIFMGFWLAISWLMFSYPSTIFDWVISLSICLFSIGSYYTRFRSLHLMNFIVGCILIGIAFSNKENYQSPIFQNYTVIGLLLLMFSIIPSKSFQPPKEWVQFLKSKQDNRR